MDVERVMAMPTPFRQAIGFGELKRSIQKRHDHRQSLWIIAGGTHLWCYQCGAFKHVDGKWQRPTGLGGPNPAMKP